MVNIPVHTYIYTINISYETGKSSHVKHLCDGPCHMTRIIFNQCFYLFIVNGCGKVPDQNTCEPNEQIMNCTLSYLYIVFFISFPEIKRTNDENAFNFPPFLTLTLKNLKFIIHTLIIDALKYHLSGYVYM